MPEISDAIEPGSLPYGDRQVIEDRMRQIVATGGDRPKTAPGAASARASQRLGSGPVSDKPVTAGLSVGPGAGPVGPGPETSPMEEKLRILATEGRNPHIRHMARTALLAMQTKRL